MINAYLVTAGVLTIAIGIVHSWLGERRLIGPLLAPGNREGILAKSGFARQVLRFAWHITTLAWWGLGAILVALSLTPLDGYHHATLIIIAVTFLLTGIVTLLTSCGRHLAWIVFFAISGLSMAPLY